MKLPDDADIAARQAGAKLRESGVLDLMNYDLADPNNATPPRPVNLNPEPAKGR